MAHKKRITSAVEVVMDALVVDMREHGARLAALVAMQVDGLHQALHQPVAALRQVEVLRDGQLDGVRELLLWLACLTTCCGAIHCTTTPAMSLFVC